ncbi:MAG: group I intron-associated PD-(D/E)XK endonuclease [Terriglobales bacterium]
MVDVASLIKNPKRRGEWAELRFMAAAAEHGLSVSKPWGDSERYDVGVEHNGQYQRVQVKSVSWRTRLSYRCGIGCSRVYKSSEIDFFAIFIVPEEIWYIVPVRMALAAGYKTLCLTPSRKENRYEVYREAWHLLRSRRFGAGGSQVVVEGELFQIG